MNARKGHRAARGLTFRGGRDVIADIRDSKIGRVGAIGSLLVAAAFFAMPVRAETLLYTCSGDRIGGDLLASATVRIKTGEESVEMIAPEGRFASRATINDTEIAWDYSQSGEDVQQDVFEGSIDRRTGRAAFRYHAMIGGGSYQTMKMIGVCTQVPDVSGER